MFDDARWGDDPRDRDVGSRDLSRGSRGGSDPRERERVDPRDVFMEGVNLPRGMDREHVHFRDHDYTLRGSETRTLTTVGAFRVVPANDLRDTFDRSLDPRHGELWHLRDSGLAQTVRLDRDTTVVTLTKEGRDLLESRRRDADSPDLPCDDQGHLQFPDVRIEYDVDGRDRTLDVEVMTPHYRGAHAAAKSGSGFALYWSGRGGGSGGRSGGRTPCVILLPFDN